MSENDRVIREAEFNANACWYWLIQGTIIFAVMIVTIPLLPVWLLFGYFFTKRYLDSHSCVLTERSVKIHKGLLNRIEKTVPLDKITDVALMQGPIMRGFGLHSLSIETAGSTGTGAFLRVVGIVGAREFRDAVLKQKEILLAQTSGGAVVGSGMAAVTPVAGGGGAELESGEVVGLLREIRDSLKRLEERG
ncbi:MAG: PH domain-containing protein [Verrucomicrobiota bacterium]